MKEVEKVDLVLIPAYEPEEQLVALTEALHSQGLQVLVVNDGSGEAYQDIFDRTARYATVIDLAKNGGKGGALKAGMGYIRDKLPQVEYFITCDADGQHRVEDVLRVRDKLHQGENFVLTVRQFQKNMPLRSKIGNDLSRFVYALLARRYLSDNQSGLRGFSRVHIDWLLQVQKNNYDYEMNVLYYAAKKNISIATMPIEAVYIGNNESSHFNPIQDTVRIYKSLFSLAGGSLISFLVSELLVLILWLFTGYDHLLLGMPLIAAVSYLVTFVLNRLVFFRGTPCHDYLSSLVYQVMLYILYTLGCLLVMFILPEVPLFLAFNLVFLICIPLRFLFHKAIFLASKTRE